MKVTVIPFIVGELVKVLKSRKENRKTWDQKKNEDNPDHLTIKIGLDTSKNPGDPKTLNVSEASVKVHLGIDMNN